MKKAFVTGALALFTLMSTVFAAAAAGPVSTANPAAAPATTLTVPNVLSAREAADLQFMREEEKLAHDVYVTLADTWGLRVFDNIAASEQQHTGAVAYWLDFYHVSEPAAGKALGQFSNPDLQALYDRLVVQGKRSIGDALKVGAAIEEIDILDLQERLAATANAGIKQTYQNLAAASQNHLRAFVSNLKARTGETYAPQYLGQAAYNAIAGAANGSGRGRRP